MNTYEQEKSKFVLKMKDYIEEYDSISGRSLSSDLDDLWNDVKLTGISPNKFFVGVRRTLLNTNGNYENVDIIKILSRDLNGTGEASISLQNYFKDIKDTYNNLPKGQLEFLDENRDDILNSNLKLVISIAKKYQNRGLTLEELISAGNLGLVTAWDKYDPEKNKLKDVLIDTFTNGPDDLSQNYIQSVFEDLISYGDGLIDDLKKDFSEHRVYHKEEILSWINSHIKKAKFSSVAALWIRAYILQELNNSSRVVKKPKSDIDKDFNETGRYLRENIVPLEADENTGCYNIDIPVYDDTVSDIDISNNRTALKSGMAELLDGISLRDRRILFRAYGIGLPRTMSIKEIAEIEDVTHMRVTQIVQNCIATMRKNAVKHGISIEKMLKFINND